MRPFRSAAPPGVGPLQTTSLKMLSLLGTPSAIAVADSTPAFRLGSGMVARSGTCPPPVTSWSRLHLFGRISSPPHPLLACSCHSSSSYFSFHFSCHSPISAFSLPMLSISLSCYSSPASPLLCPIPLVASSYYTPTTTHRPSTQPFCSVFSCNCRPRSLPLSLLWCAHPSFMAVLVLFVFPQVSGAGPRPALTGRGRCPWPRRLLGVHRAHVPPSQLTFRIDYLVAVPCYGAVHCTFHNLTLFRICLPPKFASHTLSCHASASCIPSARLSDCPAARSSVTSPVLRPLPLSPCPYWPYSYHATIPPLSAHPCPLALLSHPPTTPPPPNISHSLVLFLSFPVISASLPPPVLVMEHTPLIVFTHTLLLPVAYYTPLAISH